MLTKTFLLLAALVSLAASSSAGLQWDKPVQEFQRLPDAHSVEAHFTFRNTGAAPVTIKTVKSSCGCTTARLEKKTFAAGESGEIVSVFNLGSRIGARRTVVTVTTDDRPQEPVTLDLRVFVHEPFEVKPALVFWRTGEAAEAKVVQLTAKGFPVRVQSVSSTNPRLAAKLETVKTGEQYAITIAPADTAQREAGEILVTTDFPPENPRTYTIHARVK